MGRRKAKKRVVNKRPPTVSKIFDCPFCDHSKCVECKLIKRTKVGRIHCRICNVNFECQIHYLSEPVDVYSEWIDECTKSNTIKQTAIEDEDIDGQIAEDDLQSNQNIQRPRNDSSSNDSNDYSEFDDDEDEKDYHFHRQRKERHEKQKQTQSKSKPGLFYKAFDTDEETDESDSDIEHRSKKRKHRSQERERERSNELLTDSEEEEAEYANTSHIPIQEPKTIETLETGTQKKDMNKNKTSNENVIANEQLYYSPHVNVNGNILNNMPMQNSYAYNNQNIAFNNQRFNGQQNMYQQRIQNEIPVNNQMNGYYNAGVSGNYYQQQQQQQPLSYASNANNYTQVRNTTDYANYAMQNTANVNQQQQQQQQQNAYFINNQSLQRQVL